MSASCDHSFICQSVTLLLCFMVVVLVKSDGMYIFELEVKRMTCLFMFFLRGCDRGGAWRIFFSSNQRLQKCEIRTIIRSPQTPNKFDTT
mmetsp:Transcript_17227/g.25629  ORF Transcript_17227/g.25629 Transcript_17227/m.25629 type:complete len:90 (-) Transcript_17227:13-282(-)